MRSRDRYRYATLMSETIWRIETLHRMIDGTRGTVYPQTTIESAALQVRKVLELVAFSSLVSNRKAYAAVRANIAKDWHANRILKAVGALNPNFYPQPQDPYSVLDGAERPFRRLRGGFLTQKQFSALYDQCSSLLHAGNPFGTPYESSHFWRKLPTTVARIETLLREHMVSFQGSSDRIWVSMSFNGDNAPIVVRHLIRKDGPNQRFKPTAPPLGLT